MTDPATAPSSPSPQGDGGIAAAPASPSPAATAGDLASGLLEVAETKPFRHTDEPTLLEQVGKPPEAPKPPETKAVEKPAEAAPKDAAAKPAEPAAPAAPVAPEAPAPIDWSSTYKLPETITMDDALRGQLHGALDAFRADPQRGAQALVDLHAAQMNAYAANLAQQTLDGQHRAFADMRSEWRKQSLADEQIGGAGHRTAMQAIARARDQFVSTHRHGTAAYAADMRAFDDFLRITGAGDHPVFNRLLHNVAAFVDEPGPPLPNAKPPKDIGRPPNGRRSGVMYDHPTSHRDR